MTSARISDEDIQNVFKVFDVDGTGSIDEVELLTALKSLGWAKVTESDVTALIEQAHEEEEAEIEEATEEQLEQLRKNRRNVLNYTQFSNFIRSKQRSADSAEEVLTAFRLFDRDHKGRINREDLKAAGRTATGKDVPDAIVDEIMRLADLDKDDFLAFDEFRRAVSKDDPAAAQLNSTVALGATIMGAQGGRAGGQGENGASTSASKSGGGSGGGATEDDADTKVEQQVIAGVKVSVISGKIAKAEVRRALTECGYEEDTLPNDVFDEVFGDSDKDTDGLLTLDEYCKLLVGFGEQVDGY